VSKSALEDRFDVQLGAFCGKRFQRGYRFAPPRRWKFDFANPKLKLAVEIEGGSWSGGRHTRGSGFEKDCEKYNEAAILGWYVIRLTTGMVTSKEMVGLGTVLRAVESITNHLQYLR